ncbi:ATP-binding protein [Caballeronia sp. LZ034LL]|nr:ATP-binding protein [Caballeronia sp. LZ034LL]
MHGRWVRLDDWLRIDVRDTGIGIAQVHREAIFAEYFQINNPGRNRSRGLGLGLSIVQRVIRIQSGHGMSFASVEGRGSRFSLYARMSEAKPAACASETAISANARDLDGLYVLLCDEFPGRESKTWRVPRRVCFPRWRLRLLTGFERASHAGDAHGRQEHAP